MNNNTDYAEFTFEDLCRAEADFHAEEKPFVDEDFAQSLEQANKLSTQFLSFVASAKL